MRVATSNSMCMFSGCDSKATWHAIDSNDDAFFCTTHKEVFEKIIARDYGDDRMQYVPINEETS